MQMKLDYSISMQLENISNTDIIAHNAVLCNTRTKYNFVKRVAEDFFMDRNILTN